MTHPHFSRRALLGRSLLASAGFLLNPRASSAAEPVSGAPVLLCVFLRGAADGLNIVVPHADAAYYKLRPSIAVAPPGKERGVIDLDGRFGLNPRLGALKAAFDAKELALVHAVGSPHPTRSHFEAQDYMQTGAVGNRSAVHGWLGRYLSLRPSTEALRALALSARTPLSLRGYRDALVTESLKEFRLGVRGELEPVLSRGFSRLYASEESRLAERAGKRALDASALVARVLSEQKKGVKYAREAQDFADVATLIKADVGLETAWIDVGGWDTHRYEGSTDRGELPKQLERLGQALATFRADLGPAFERVLVVVMSEFGRTARENGTGGTDHGHGNVMLLLGGKVQGGRVLGTLPGLEAEHLFEGRDVPVTTDFRDVLAEVCERHLALPDASALFPGYALDRQRRLGFI
ncbi:MAG: DUF1501 domain-containing protein [Myxococcales bacterium]|nr:MAG: DUF1501 domain-containing protein [Myxococcales bacterium]